MASATRKPKYPLRRVIAVDVDGTLHINGLPNTALIAWCRERKEEGYTLILWSGRGEAHARSVAAAFGCAEVFAAILSKPGYVVDDEGWSWIKYTRALWPADMQERTLPEADAAQTESSGEDLG